MSVLVKPSHSDDWFAGRRVTVMGLGQFGGGLGVAQWMHQRGACVHITDLASEKTLHNSLEPIAGAITAGAITLRLGSHEMRDFQQADLVIANAAVPRPWENPFLCAARSAGVPVTTEIRLAIERLATNRVIAITGSAGKSTTTAMTACALAGSGREVRVGGNIGGSLLGAPAGSAREWTMLELSSAQLWWLSPESGDNGWSPTIAVLTNIAANHIDWHGTIAHYIESKAQIRRHQSSTDLFLSAFARESPEQSSQIARESSSGAWWMDGSEPALPAVNEIALSIPGAHQQRNAQLALAITAACAQFDGESVNLEGARCALKSFSGLEHRLQSVGTVGGVQCFNDSKATTPEATQLAIAAFDDPARVHLIAGGYDKKVDLSAIRDLAPKLAGLYAIGETAHAIAAHPPAMRFESLTRAVEEAFSRAKAGDILLLSPGCASWDQFINYEERGRLFVNLVRARAALSHC
ncbi:MAG: UDP-N-acetylmuramoyl-L-alanine--D-glutamate ligase [Phycisphaerales bacterium]|nr:UDP-N-acetylmuramoyl-L-alanine--D-glutamate ligase [Phycisphaerales bacterium]